MYFTDFKELKQVIYDRLKTAKSVRNTKNATSSFIQDKPAKWRIILLGNVSAQCQSHAV
ncbi:hypothetical protein N473_12040 [Pseudoalteromonas luteoviolacea CPMOR-1]|uniref:Uncharacterized protein n=1 Tax=Pseudoalteromonas luteoviolacea CPMOR-1 TaxID=1365248 RepID=A0A167M3N8_9GAMM|nr:hypothetical protein N473_12040 [Pseudoalteromonas luteoviolacea CPMOR-1]